jgi:hypothetical protein
VSTLRIDLPQSSSGGASANCGVETPVPGVAQRPISVPEKLGRPGLLPSGTCFAMETHVGACQLPGDGPRPRRNRFTWLGLSCLLTPPTEPGPGSPTPHKLRVGMQGGPRNPRGAQAPSSALGGPMSHLLGSSRAVVTRPVQGDIS